MMASRKIVLDKNKKELLDSVNASNKVYTNEELSILVQNLKGELTLMNEKYDASITELKNYNSDIPIGEYDLFTGNYYTESTTDTIFSYFYRPQGQIKLKFNEKNREKYKMCFEFTTSSRHDDVAYITVVSNSQPDKKIVFKSALWGHEIDGNFTECVSVPENFVSDDMYELRARVSESGYGLSIYRIYLLVY